MAETWEAIVASLINDLDQSLAGRYSAVLYGSAARGDWVAGVSDINLLLVLDDTSPASLRGLAQPFANWRKSGNAPPMVLSREEWAGAADAFPIEVTDILHAYKVLKGADPVAGMRVAPADLRTLLEHEFLGQAAAAAPRLRGTRRRAGGAGTARHRQRLDDRAPAARPAGPAGPERAAAASRRWYRRPRSPWARIRPRSSSSCGIGPTRSGWQRGNSSNRTWRPWKRPRDL